MKLTYHASRFVFPITWLTILGVARLRPQSPEAPQRLKALSGRRWGRRCFARPTLQVARDLLGQRLVRIQNDKRLSGLITEAEAYIGEEDLACHARFGRTARSEVMYGPPGYAYVYFTYGLHWMLNAVTEEKDFPAAVLIRAILPLEGIEIMRRRRGRPDKILTDGPAKVTQALGIDKRLNGHDLCGREAVLFIESENPVPDEQVLAGPRVGLGATPEPWLSQPWNFKWQKSEGGRQ